MHEVKFMHKTLQGSEVLYIMGMFTQFCAVVE